MIAKLQKTMLATSFVLTGISSIANDSTKVATAQNSPSINEINKEIILKSHPTDSTKITNIDSIRITNLETIVNNNKNNINNEKEMNKGKRIYEERKINEETTKQKINTTTENNSTYVLPSKISSFEITSQLETYVNQINQHVKYIENYVNKYSSFDTTYSNKKNLIAFSFGLFTQESRLQQIRSNGKTIQSVVQAKGVGQFRKLGLLQVNEYKNQRIKIDSNYAKIKDLNWELAISPTPQGGEENIRAGVLLHKILLEKFQGDWKMALAEYNMGMTKLNKLRGPENKSFEQIYNNLPSETKTYISHIEQYMKSFENVEQYKEKLIENFAFGLIAKNNIKGNKSSDLSYQKEQYFSEIINLEKYVEENNLFKTGTKFNRLVAHAQYELGKALYKQGKYELSKNLLVEAQENNPSYSYEKKGANYLLKRLNEKIQRMNIAEVKVQ